MSTNETLETNTSGDVGYHFGKSESSSTCSNYDVTTGVYNDFNEPRYTNMNLVTKMKGDVLNEVSSNEAHNISWSTV